MAPKPRPPAEDAGIVATWPIRGSVAVTLTPYAAAAIGVELVEFGRDDDPETRWAPIDPDPGPIWIHQELGGHDAAMALAVDKSPGPGERKEAEYAAAAIAALLRDLRRVAARERENEKRRRKRKAGGAKKAELKATRNSFDLDALRAGWG